MKLFGLVFCGCIVMTGTTLAAGPSDGLNVNIVNTPVPIKGTVAISNFPTPAATRLVSLRGPLSSDGGCAPFLAGQALNFTVITNPDGTEQPFSIPAGSVLVITAVDVLGFDTAPGANIQTRLFRGVNGTALNESSIRESTANAVGRIFHRYEFPSGIEVASGGLVCVNANDNNLVMSGFLYGFLR